MAMATKDLSGVGLLGGSPVEFTEISGDWLESVAEETKDVFGGPTASDLIESTNGLSR